MHFMMKRCIVRTRTAVAALAGLERDDLTGSNISISVTSTYSIQRLTAASWSVDMHVGKVRIWET